MTSIFKPSAACCNTPAVIGPPYNPKGELTEIGATTVYAAGPKKAEKALFVLYDIFGYSGQILQGVDKLAEHYLILMPAFFGDNAAPLDWMPSDGPEDMAKIEDFTAGSGDSQKMFRLMGELRQKFQEMAPQIERRGLLGYCRADIQVASFAIGRDTPFSACAICHPGFVGAELVSQISVPQLALCSKDEPESEFNDFKAALRIEHHFEIFPRMVHGG